MAASDLFEAFLVQKIILIMKTNSKLSFLVYLMNRSKRICDNCITKLL